MDNRRQVVHLAVLQPDLKPRAATRNMIQLRETIEGLVAEEPLDLVVLPETFDGWHAPPPDADRSSEARQFLRNVARACRVNIVGGSVDRPVPGDRSRNTCLIVDRSGEEAGHYDKRVLFSQETERRSPGEHSGIFEVDGMRIGVLICADLWRPELARELVGSVDLLCVPAKSAVLSDRHTAYARTLWENLALTRALENGLVVAVSDWAAGRHEEVFLADGHETRRTFFTCGGSSVCDPGHRPNIELIQRRPVTDSGLVRVTVDLGALAEYRKYRRAVGLLPSD